MFSLLEYPPVLTPKTVELLNGQLGGMARKYLLALIDAAIKNSFKPFAEYEGIQLARKFNSCCRRYEPYRLEANLLLVQEVGVEGLSDILKAGTELIKKEMDAIGAKNFGFSPDWLNSVVSSYWSAVSPLLEYAPDSDELLAVFKDLLWSATRFDFSLTAVFLVLEGEIVLIKAARKYIVTALDSALAELNEYTSRIVRKVEDPEKRFWRLMREKGMWLGKKQPAGKKKRPKNAFKPIPVKGEPVSETIIRERR